MKSSKSICGEFQDWVIYTITNTKNGKQYLGSSFDYERRRKRHLSNLKAGKHHSIKLQNAYNKYGKDCFEFKVVETGNEVNFCFAREQCWINRLDPFYNMTKDVSFNKVPTEVMVQRAKKVWANPEYRERIKQSGVKKAAGKASWATPELRETHLKRLKGNKYAVGLVVDPIKVKKAGRISSMKRWFKDKWVEEYFKRYPDTATEDLRSYL